MPYKNKEDKKKKNKQYYLKNKDKLVEYAKQWKKNNPEKVEGTLKKNRLYRLEKMKEYGKQYYQDNRDKILERQKQYSQNHKDKRKEYHKQYNKINKEKIREQKKQYFQIHRLEINNRRIGYYKHKGRTDLRYSLGHKISNAIREALKGNKAGRHWEDLVGYTLNDLIKRLKKTMPKGYTWENYLAGDLHVDHHIPLSAYNFTKPEHIGFKKCWALKNLRLLPAKENISKKDKLEKPFQLTLNI